MKVVTCVFFLIIQFNGIVCDKECLNLDVSITQKVEHDGYHREIKWLVETISPEKSKWIDSSCKLLLQLIVSPGMFVNPDEVAELNRTGELSLNIDGTVNVELPAHEATKHTVHLYLNNSEIDRISLKLPVHMRYQRAQIAGGYGKVPLSKPNLLAWCPGNLNKICGKGIKVEAPCDFNTSEICDWKNITYQTLFDYVELYVPVGDLDDYPLVSIVTLLLGCAGCIYVLSILSTTPL